jgi:hypothetical protein
MRVVMELKRDAVKEIILNQLYKHTQLQATFGVILLAIVNNRPAVLTFALGLSLGYGLAGPLPQLASGALAALLHGPRQLTNLINPFGLGNRRTTDDRQWPQTANTAIAEANGTGAPQLGHSWEKAYILSSGSAQTQNARRLRGHLPRDQLEFAPHGPTDRARRWSPEPPPAPPPPAAPPRLSLADSKKRGPAETQTSAP